MHAGVAEDNDSGEEGGDGSAEFAWASDDDSPRTGGLGAGKVERAHLGMARIPQEETRKPGQSHADALSLAQQEQLALRLLGQG